MGKILTVSIAAYNMEKYLARCLDSFLIPEIMDDIEVLIINDGSTDTTAVIANEYVLRYPVIFKLISKENGGHGSTINTGIKEASGKYFKVVDADDWVEREGMTELVSVLKLTLADAVVSPLFNVNADTGEKKLVNLVNNYESACKNRILSVKDVDITFLAIHQLTFRTEILKNNYTPIDEHCYYVDMEYVFYYYYFVRTVIITETPVYDYYIGDREQSINLSVMVKRRDQHFKVCKSMITFYNDRKRDRYAVDHIKKTLYQMILYEYNIFLHIENVLQSQKETIEFDKMLQFTIDRDDYKNIISYGIHRKSKVAFVIGLLRRTHFHGYKLVYSVVQYRVKHQ